MKKLRIIQVANVRWFNATAWYALSLGRLLSEAGHEVMAIVPPGTETSERAKAMPSRRVEMDLNSPSPVAVIRQLSNMRKCLKNFRPDIVNCHRGEGMVLWGMLKAAGGNFALIRTRGDQRPPKANFPNRYLHARLADAVIATNSRTALQCRERLGVPADRLFTIPGGTDRHQFPRDPEAGLEVRRSLGIDDNQMIVGLLGRFDPVKGHRELMRAFSAVRSKTGSARLFRLMLVGYPAGISLEEMRSMAASFGLEDSIIIADRVERTASFINAMDMAVVASQGSEAIARAAFEIMSCNTPLIATDVGVMPDLLSARALCPTGDHEALERLLGQAMFEPDFRQSLRDEQGLRSLEFSSERFMEQTLEVYRAAIATAG